MRSAHAGRQLVQLSAAQARSAQPPVEADLEETYYYRFREPDGYGIQRLYTSEDRDEQVLRVTHGDLVLVREGYHPFVASPASMPTT